MTRLHGGNVVRRSRLGAVPLTVKTVVAVTALLAAGLSAPASAAPASCSQREGRWRPAGPTFPRGSLEILPYSEARRVAVEPLRGSFAYADNGSVVLATRDAGCTWRQVFELADVLDDGVADPTRTYNQQEAHIAWVQTGAAAQSPGEVWVAVAPVPLYGWSVAGPRYLFHSSDSGRTWRRADVGLETVPLEWGVLTVAPSEPRTAYLAVHGTLRGPGGLFVTHNGGESWSRLGDLVSNGRAGVLVDPANPRRLWYLQHAFKDDAVVVESTDGGKTFARVSRGRRCLARLTLPLDGQRRSRVLFAAACGIDPSDGRPRREVLVSRDSGRSFTALNLPGPLYTELWDVAPRSATMVCALYRHNPAYGSGTQLLCAAASRNKVVWRSVGGPTSATRVIISREFVWSSPPSMAVMKLPRR